MGTGFEHTALAVFTTLAPMGAGAFIALAYAFIAGAPDETAAKRLDCWTALPLAVSHDDDTGEAFLFASVVRFPDRHDRNRSCEVEHVEHDEGDDEQYDEPRGVHVHQAEQAGVH